MDNQDMIETNKYGIYHATNEGFCSWYDFAKEIFNISGVDIKVNPIETSEYPTKATRPMNSKMSKEKLTLQGFYKLRNWKESLEDYINQERDEMKKHIYIACPANTATGGSELLHQLCHKLRGKGKIYDKRIFDYRKNVLEKTSE